MTIKDCGCKGCSLWLRLEGERLDKTYRAAGYSAHKPIKPVAAITKRVYVRNIERERMLYNAGRFAGGDRDKEAILAYAELEKEFARERKK